MAFSLLHSQKHWNVSAMMFWHKMLFNITSIFPASAWLVPGFPCCWGSHCEEGVKRHQLGPELNPDLDLDLDPDPAVSAVPHHHTQQPWAQPVSWDRWHHECGTSCCCAWQISWWFSERKFYIWRLTSMWNLNIGLRVGGISPTFREPRDLRL